MTTAQNRSPGRYLARLLLCLAAVVAVFAMHGPSSDHMLAMPTRGPASAGMAGHAPEVHAVGPARTVSRIDRRVNLATGLGTCGRSHADCLATLRSAAVAPPAPSFTGMVAAIPALGAGSASLVAAVPRAPPRPSLDRLCISRT